MTDTAMGAVVKVLDDYRLVLNKGSQDGITSDDRFLVFALGEELTDPLTRESLGKLEIVKGRGRPAHIQERMTTIISDRFTGEGKRRIVKRSGGGLWSIGAPSEEEIIEPGSQVREAFDNPKVGDMVKKLPR